MSEINVIKSGPITPIVQNAIEPGMLEKSKQVQKPNQQVISEAADAANIAAQSTTVGLRQPQMQAKTDLLANQLSSGFDITAFNDGYSGRKAELYNLLVEVLEKYRESEAKLQGKHIELSRESAVSGGNNMIDAAKARMNQVITGAAVAGSLSAFGAGSSIRNLSKQNKTIKTYEKQITPLQENLDKLERAASASRLTGGPNDTGAGVSGRVISERKMEINQAKNQRESELINLRKKEQVANAVQSNAHTLGNLSGQSFVLEEAERQRAVKLDNSDEQVRQGSSEMSRKALDTAIELLREILRLQNDEQTNRVQSGNAILNGIKG